MPCTMQRTMRRATCRAPTCGHYGMLETSRAQAILRELDEDGYCVLPKVFSPDEMEAELDRMWGFIETIEPSIKRDMKSSWEKGALHVCCALHACCIHVACVFAMYIGHGHDPWPCKQRDMFQLHQAGNKPPVD